jgi:multicomponent Na+:H+ antiporter subunit A
MKRSIIVDTSVRVLYHSIWVVSLYFLFAGHNQPGGGFVGGLIAGAAIALRYVAGGVDDVRSALPLQPWTVLGLGLLIGAGTASVPILLGHGVLDHASFSATLPLLGDVKATSALPFDIGVYLVVLGMVLLMFEAFGDEVAFDEQVQMFVPGDALEADSIERYGPTRDPYELDRIAAEADRRRIAARSDDARPEAQR